MVIFEAKNFAPNQIRCDHELCVRDGKPFSKEDQFVGCTNCGEWDICLECHKK